MSSLSRRAFLKRGSLAVTMAGVAATLPAGLLEAGETGAGAASASAELPEGAALTEPIVAHVRDLAAGDINLYVGTREVAVRDPHLAARLFNAAR
jgi:hypothetical protein